MASPEENAKIRKARAAPSCLVVFNIHEDFVPIFVAIQRKWKIQGYITCNPFLTFSPDDKLLNVHAVPKCVGSFNITKDFAPDFVTIQHKWKIQGYIICNRF